MVLAPNDPSVVETWVVLSSYKNHHQHHTTKETSRLVYYYYQLFSRMFFFWLSVWRYIDTSLAARRRFFAYNKGCFWYGMVYTHQEKEEGHVRLEMDKTLSTSHLITVTVSTVCTGLFFALVFWVISTIFKVPWRKRNFYFVNFLS